MKKLYYLLLLSFIAITSQSCKDNNQAFEPPSNWAREQFNSNYTIMTPDNYEGGIYQHNEGTTFRKTRNDDKIVISGGFCDSAAYPCMASDYNTSSEPIENNIDSIGYTNLNGNPDYLNKKIIISNNQNDIVLFFYTNSHQGSYNDSYGILFFNDLSNSDYSHERTNIRTREKKSYLRV